MADIFIGLGFNASFFTVFALVFIGFFILRTTFLVRLQDVLELREEKTTKLESQADHEFQEIDRLSKEYENKIESAYKDARVESTMSKNEITKKLDGEYKKVEKEVNDYVDKEREVSLSEIEQKSKEIMGQAKELSSALVDKLIQ